MHLPSRQTTQGSWDVGNMSEFLQPHSLAILMMLIRGRQRYGEGIAGNSISSGDVSISMIESLFQERPTIKGVHPFAFSAERLAPLVIKI